MGEIETRFGIRIDRLYPLSEWNIGISMGHLANETYLYIALFFVSICIGRLGFSDDGDEWVNIDDEY